MKTQFTFLLSVLFCFNTIHSQILSEVYFVDFPPLTEFCMGTSVSFRTSSIDPSSHPPLDFIWGIESCDDQTLGSSCSSWSPYQTVTTNTDNFTHQFSDPGRFRVTVTIKEQGTGNVLATPCLSSPCSIPIVDVYGTVVPSFSINNTQCSYDPSTGLYTSVVEIEPTVNTTGTAFNGTSLAIDWGDGQSSSFTAPNTPGGSLTSHTYSWSPISNPSPSFQIDVDAYTLNISPACPPASYSLTYAPMEETPEISFTILETGCEMEIVCFGGLDGFIDAQIFDPANDLAGNMDPSVDPCFEFDQNGTYTFLLSDGQNACPYVYTYHVVLAPPTAGALSSPNSYITPGDPIDVMLTNPANAYVAYEVYVDNCAGGTVWAPFAFGDPATMNNYTIPDYITSQFTPCMLNDDFEICIRAQVVCEEIGDIYTPSGVTSNQICFPICAGGQIDPGGNDDPNDPGQWLQGETGGADQIAEDKFIDGELAINIYPNPTSELIFIEFDATANLTELELVNAQGQLLEKRKINELNQSSSLIELDVEKYPAGLYFVRLMSNQEKQIVRPILILR